MTDVNKYVLGTAYEGYASEVIVDTPKLVAAGVKSGLVVGKKSDGSVSFIGDTGVGAPYGVSGQNNYPINTPVQTMGLKVCVRMDAGADPTIGTPAYVLPTGEVTEDSTATGAVALAATFASEKVVGIDTADNSEVDAVLLDFATGL